jgi:hypothetical protein
MWCGFVVDFLEPIGGVSGEGRVAGLEWHLWKCINIHTHWDESEFILGKGCWIH